MYENWLNQDSFFSKGTWEYVTILFTRAWLNILSSVDWRASFSNHVRR